MPLLQSLLGQLFGGSATPESNPDKKKAIGDIDEDGNLLDENGDVVSNHPYKDPNFATKLFFPNVANTEAEKNIAFDSAASNATNDANARLAGRRTLLGPVASQFAGQTLNELASTIENFGSEKGLNDSVGARAYANTGAPGAVGETEGHTDINNSRSGLLNSIASLSRNPIVNKLLDINSNTDLLEASRKHSRQPMADNLRDEVVRNTLDREQTFVPKQNLFDTNDADFRLGQQPIEHDIHSLINQGGVNDAAYNAALSQTRNALTPTGQGTLIAKMRNDLYDELHPNVPGLFYRDGGSFARNPASPSMIESMTGKMQSSGGPTTIPLGNGLHLPTSNVATSTKTNLIAHVPSTNIGANAIVAPDNNPLATYGEHNKAKLSKLLAPLMDLLTNRKFFDEYNRTHPNNK